MIFPVFNDMNIRGRILIVFQFMIIPLLVLFIVFLLITHKMQNIQSTIILKNLTSITAAYNVENSLLNLKELKANYILDGNRQWLVDFGEGVRTFNYWYNEAFQLAVTDTEKDILSVMSLEFSQYLKAHSMMLVLADNGKKDKAVKMLVSKSMDHFNAIYRGCDQLIQINQGAINTAEKEFVGYVKKSRLLAYAVILFSVIFGVALVIIISNSIVTPIMEIEKASVRFKPFGNYRNEIGRLKERFDLMVSEITSNQQKLIVAERRAAVGEIAAGISHELNNPIAIICGFTELLLKSPSIKGKEQGFIRDINTEANRCKKLLGEFLDYARAPEPQFMECDVLNIMKETLNILSAQEKYEKVCFGLDVKETTYLSMADSMQIRQVFLNIIINACDAVSLDGRVDISFSSDGKYITVVIRDNGPGIKEDDLPRIFLPFYTTKTKGVGLGLAICSDIMAKHGGSISAAEKNGPGAEFVITIPGYKNERK